MSIGILANAHQKVVQKIEGTVDIADGIDRLPRRNPKWLSADAQTIAQACPAVTRTGRVRQLT